jgi:hypothetical protein
MESAHVSWVSTSLSLRFAPACDGPMTGSAEAVELESSDTSMSEERSPSSSRSVRGCTWTGSWGIVVPLVAVGCVLVGSAV